MVVMCVPVAGRPPVPERLPDCSHGSYAHTSDREPHTHAAEELNIIY